MANAMFLAWSSPISPEADEEFNRWYVDTHIPQVRTAIPAVTQVRRYRLLGSGQAGAPVRYLCSYELADGDAAAAAAALAAAGKAQAFDLTPTMDLIGAPPETHFLEPLD